MIARKLSFTLNIVLQMKKLFITGLLFIFVACTNISNTDNGNKMKPDESFDMSTLPCGIIVSKDVEVSSLSSYTYYVVIKKDNKWIRTNILIFAVPLLLVWLYDFLHIRRKIKKKV